jgi:protein transport protein SEC24
MSYNPPPSGYPPNANQQQQYQVGAFGQPNTMQPPSSNYGPPNTMQPPSSNYGPPGTSAPVSMAPTTKAPVQFYSTGAPNIAAPVPSMGPPSSMAPPPTNSIPGQPQFISAMGPLTMPPPPTNSIPGQPQFISAPPGSIPDPNIQSYPGQMYGAPPPNSNIGLPSQFDSSGYLPGAGTDPTQQSAPLPTLAELDLSVKCNPAFMRSTVSKIVNSQAAANASRIPIGVNIRPMAGDKGTINDEIEVIDFGTTGIVRCKRCRTYVNPFVSWIDSGRRWRCNICGMQNDTPNSYFSNLDANGQRRDKDERPELSKCSVEFVAPGDYMVRPPQPPVYFFVIDVSSVSIASGMLQSCVNAIKASLDELPGAPRTQIGFITFDSTIHFYNLKSTLAAPQMLVVPDISDIILPLPEDLLVNLHDSRTVVDALLDSLPGMFRNNTAVNTCTGPALTSAKNVMGHIGGKLCLFQSSLPTIGEGSLKPRDNPRLLGSDKEHTLLNAEEAWYKNNAIDFSRLQVAVDCFLFSGQYTDLATLSVLSRYSGGTVYYYPGFTSVRDGVKFERELHHDLTRATAFEAVMRVRATRGLRITNFYGNYFIRGTDLLALPNCTSDSTFGLDIAYDETI